MNTVAQAIPYGKFRRQNTEAVVIYNLLFTIDYCNIFVPFVVNKNLRSHREITALPIS